MPTDIPTDINEALDAYTADPPPPTFSLDGVLAGGRRRRRTRRLAGGGALLAVALGGALAVPSLLPAQLPAQLPTQLPSQLPAPAPLVPGRSCPAAGDLAVRVGCYLSESVPPLLPGATLAVNSSGGPQRSHATPSSDPGGVATDPRDVSVSVVVNGTGAISFGTGPSTESAAAAARDCTGPPRCIVRTDPHGDTVIVTDSVAPGGGHWIDVRVYRGGYTTLASAGAGDGSALPGAVRQPGDPEPGTATPPLTADQLTTVAAGLAFYLFP